MSDLIRPNCLAPTACEAKGKGHCRRCNMASISKAISQSDRCAARKAALADPEVRARMSAARKAALADPEVRARMSESLKRAHGKAAVIAAGLAPFRKFVDRACALFAEGEHTEVVIDALTQEFGRAA
jgi:hypothetical protein